MKPFIYRYEKFPRYIQIETTIICQANCYFCPQKKATRRPLIMEWNIIEKVLDETKGLGITYRPFILNEPFSDKRMVAVVKQIKTDPTAKVEFNTNGELMTHDITDRLLDLGVDTMRFSIDGITKETFDETRGIKFDKVYDNVGYFVEKSVKENYPVDIEVRMIRFPGTEKEQIQYKTFWEDKGAKVVFTDLYRYPWEGQTESITQACLKILDETFVYVDGRVTLCCWDYAERAIMGDVKTENILDIWNGLTMQKHRDLLSHGNRKDIHLCSRCDAYKDLDFNQIQQTTTI